MSDQKHKPIVVKKRIVDSQGKTVGVRTKTDMPGVTEVLSCSQMLDKYGKGHDFIIEKGTNVSELVIVHRLTDHGMSYHFRCIADKHENNNFLELETELNDGLIPE